MQRSAKIKVKFRTFCKKTVSIGLHDDTWYYFSRTTLLLSWISGLFFEPSPLSDLEAFYNDPTAAGQQSPKPDRMDYILPTAAPCQPGQFLVIYVHTAPAHHSRRLAVRSTWGNVTRWSTANSPVTLRFVMGRPASDNDHLQRALADEQTIHADLVQLDFIDSYSNITLKGVGAVQWVSDYCPHTRWAAFFTLNNYYVMWIEHCQWYCEGGVSGYVHSCYLQIRCYSAKSCYLL